LKQKWFFDDEEARAVGKQRIAGAAQLKATLFITDMLRVC
jgi:hypothetical protein